MDSFGFDYVDDPSQDGGGFSLGGFASQLLNTAATLTNTALISDANPVNAALLTNTPLSTPAARVGAAADPSKTILVLGGLAIVGLVFFEALSGRRR